MTGGVSSALCVDASACSFKEVSGLPLRRGIQAATAKPTERRTAREPGPAPRRALPHDQWLSEEPLTALTRRVAGYVIAIAIENKPA